jgi:hypothetical protein
MAFGKKPAAPPAESTPPPVEPTATERLNALLAEQAEIEATLAQHRKERTRLLREDGALGAIRAMQTEDDALKLRLEQIAVRLPDIYRVLELERVAAWEAAWATHVPVLAAAEADLVRAITAFFAAHEHAQKVYSRARGFGARLTEQFVTPPPPAPVYNDWSLRQYLAVVERRQQGIVGSGPLLALDLVDPPLNIPPERRFVPRRVPIAQIEAISPIAETQRVRILHGPVRTSNLQIGIARMFAGEVHTVSARAAFALVNSGIAQYDVDEAATAAA